MKRFIYWWQYDMVDDIAGVIKFVLVVALLLGIGFVLNKCGVGGCYYHVDEDEQCEHNDG